MKKVQVIEVERYRDGGTVVYQDEINRRYYQWFPNKKVYNQMPFPRGSVGSNGIPHESVDEILVELEIVNSFYKPKSKFQERLEIMQDAQLQQKLNRP